MNPKLNEKYHRIRSLSPDIPQRATLGTRKSEMNNLLNQLHRLQQKDWQKLIKEAYSAPLSPPRQPGLKLNVKNPNKKSFSNPQTLQLQALQLQPLQNQTNKTSHAEKPVLHYLRKIHKKIHKESELKVKEAKQSHFRGLSFMTKIKKKFKIGSHKLPLSPPVLRSNKMKLNGPNREWNIDFALFKSEYSQKSKTTARAFSPIPKHQRLMQPRLHL
mmetsp:Transcript_26525/g.26401  ORF Transcript_26525/g.26401 Transcript_26525/m.26401 type:complete len:216 (-) Transcript_26525:118-765(-)